MIHLMCDDTSATQVGHVIGEHDVGAAHKHHRIRHIKALCHSIQRLTVEFAKNDQKRELELGVAFVEDGQHFGEIRSEDTIRLVTNTHKCDVLSAFVIANVQNSLVEGVEVEILGEEDCRLALCDFGELLFEKKEREVHKECKEINRQNHRNRKEWTLPDM